MPGQDFLYMLVFYGGVISAALVALIMLQFYKREQHQAYLIWSLAFLVGAVRYAAPAIDMHVDSPASLFGLYTSGLHGLLILCGASLLFGVKPRLYWLTFPLLLFAWVWLAVEMSWPFWLRSGVVSLVGALGFFSLAWCFLRNQPAFPWNGYRLFAIAAGIQGLHLLAYPLVRLTDFLLWGFAFSQFLHYVMVIALLLIWVRHEEHRASEAHQIRDKAMQRVLRSRRRIVQMRRWTDALLGQISDGVVVMEMNGLIKGFNAGAEKIFGYQSDSALGHPVSLLIPEHLHASYRETLEQVLASPDSHLLKAPLEFRGQRADGRIFPVEITLSWLSLDDTTQLVAIIRDVSERVQQQERLNYLAEHDVLTGLPNRRCFEYRLAELLEKQVMDEPDRQGWLAFLDMDDFKLINDNLGHRAGDHALVALSRRLHAVAGEQALISRFSGDEFTLYRPASSETSITSWLEQLSQALRQPVAFDGVEFMLSGTMGYCIYPDDGGNVDELVRHADMAMYHAKREGKNRYRRYRHAMLEEQQRTADIATRLKLMNMDEELSLVFQPRMTLEGRELNGAEVLVRWNTPDGIAMSPEIFIPVAEETGQILRIGHWVLQQSCRALTSWGEAGQQIVLSINLSARQLFDEQLVDRIEGIRRQYELQPSQLEFEVTESSAMQDLEHAITVLNQLRNLGYRLSLDDFGTGYSSLSHLRRLPIDTVKIDRAFIKDMDHDRHDRVLVASIIELGANLDMKVLAEGVETQEQLSLLDSLGCDEVQGFLIARPMPEERFIAEVLTEWSTLTAAL